MTDCGHTWTTWEAGWIDHLCQLEPGHPEPCSCHCGSIHRHNDQDHDQIDELRQRLGQQ